MSVSTARGQIFSALKDLRLRWQEARQDWDDGVAREFQERYWGPLEAATISALAALDRLDQVLIQIRQDCGEGGEFDEETSE